MIDVIGLKEFIDWYNDLNEADTDAVTRSVDRLAKAGVTLRFPYCSAVKGTRYPLRELRVKTRGKQFRILYAFDPKRQAILIIGGDKVGDDRFYERTVPRAEKLWDEYLDELD